MHVSFKRTAERRYAVVVEVPGRPPSAAEPAPGYDPDIPHDLVHYVVEATLGLTNGVYGRAARGAGSFILTGEQPGRPRERARQQRKQQRRERALRSQAGAAELELATSERLAALSDVAWRRRAGQQPDRQRASPALREGDAARVDRIVAALARLAPAWRSLPVGGQLAFEWPALEPTAVTPRVAG